MAYSFFEADKPDGTETGPNIPADTRNNLRAVVDGLVMGCFHDWEYSQEIGTGTEAQPQYWHYIREADTDQRLRGTVVWGTTGGSAGAVEYVFWERTYDGGSNWETIGGREYTYSANGTCTAAGWD